MKVVDWRDGRVGMLDQRELPGTVAFLELGTVDEVADGIRGMAVRGAPAIGIAAAYGMALAARRIAGDDLDAWLAGWDEARARLRSTRPTAVNLAWALDRVDRVARGLIGGAGGGGASAGGDFAAIRSALEARILEEARAIDDEDEGMCRAMGAFGAELVPAGAQVLTHCNAGGLATGGYGTAVGVIRSAWEKHHDIHVIVDETRPLLQGARLTAWELQEEGIPYTLITDNMAGWFMRRGEIGLAIVGADRICANGDVTNKIGTYSVAVLARHHGIPFYVAAPFSTVDLSLKSGDEVVIEQRDPSEVTQMGGRRTAPQAAIAANPAFDVTPAEYVTAIITERGVLRPPYEKSLAEAASLEPRLASSHAGRPVSD